ncbi:MAG: hypothetical protein EHM55_01705 [Acidobacteria bacterium]|nr:MAG: hypothetical protein EHM55_01705 [Acidobacteriota bacterium]
MLPQPLADGRSLTDTESSARGVLREWRAAGIPYCALRYSLDEASPGGDFDLLVEESWMPRCRQWLEQRGFVAVPGRSPFKLVMLRYQQGHVLCFDIHWQAVQYGIVYMDARRMLARRVESDGLFHLSAEDELIHLVVHNFLRKGPLRTSALGRIRRLLKAPLDRDYLHDHLDAFGLRSAFEDATALIERGDATTGSATESRKRLFRTALLARPGNLARHVKLRLRARTLARRRGGLVALVGPDGAGKSTVIRALTERARAIPNLKISTTYLGPWGQMQLALVPALRRVGITPTVRPAGLHLASRPTSARSWLGSVAKGGVFYAALYVELMYRYVTSVFFRVRKGQWVVADRYITDLRYLYKERPISNYAAIRRLLCGLFPKPDLLIVLDNRPEVIVSRKSGLTAGQIETLRNFNLKAARSYRFEVVTTDRAPEEVADHILNRMLSLRAEK